MIQYDIVIYIYIYIYVCIVADSWKEHPPSRLSAARPSAGRAALRGNPCPQGATATTTAATTATTTTNNNKDNKDNNNNNDNNDSNDNNNNDNSQTNDNSSSIIIHTTGNHIHNTRTLAREVLEGCVVVSPFFKVLHFDILAAWQQYGEIR